MPGQPFAYYVHAFNTGAEACTDVGVTDTLDDRLAFVGCNRGCTSEGREVTWTLDELSSGSSATFDGSPISGPVVSTVLGSRLPGSITAELARVPLASSSTRTTTECRRVS